MSDTSLLSLAEMQRHVEEKIRDTLSARWTEMTARLDIARAQIGKDPSVRYDTRADQAEILRGRVTAVHAFLDAIEPVFEHIAAEAADFGGVRDAGFDNIRATFEEQLSLVEKAADNLDEQSGELRAEARALELAGRK